MESAIYSYAFFRDVTLRWAISSSLPIWHSCRDRAVVDVGSVLRIWRDALSDRLELDGKALDRLTLVIPFLHANHSTAHFLAAELTRLLLGPRVCDEEETTGASDVSHLVDTRNLFMGSSDFLNEYRECVSELKSREYLRYYNPN